MARILVIDDTTVIRELLQETLTAHGYEVVSAENSDQGMRHIKEKPPDLIITDIDLPDISGLELTKMLRIHTETRNVAIIMMTGSSKDAQTQGFQAGADDFVLKPFKVDEMIERVRAVLRRTQARTSSHSLPDAAAVLPTPPQPVFPHPAVPSQPPRAIEARPVPGPSAAPSAPQSAAPSAAGPAARLAAAPTWQQTVMETLLNPGALPRPRVYPPIATAVLLALIVLINLGVFISPGTSAQPVLVSLFIASLWGCAITTLMVACSLFGLNIGWAESARLVSLAALPLLVKFAGACLFSLITTLSPFLFTFSPALFFAPDNFLLARLDLFEIWSLALLWSFIRGRPNASQAAASVVAAAVWIVIAGVSAMICYLRPS